MSAKMGCSQSSCGAPGLPNTDFDGCSLDLSSIDSMDCEYPSVLPNEAGAHPVSRRGRALWPARTRRHFARPNSLRPPGTTTGHCVDRDSVNAFEVVVDRRDGVCRRFGRGRLEVGRRAELAERAQRRKARSRRRPVSARHVSACWSCANAGPHRLRPFMSSACARKCSPSMGPRSRPCCEFPRMTPSLAKRRSHAAECS